MKIVTKGVNASTTTTTTNEPVNKQISETDLLNTLQVKGTSHGGNYRDESTIKKKKKIKFRYISTKKSVVFGEKPVHNTNSMKPVNLKWKIDIYRYTETPTIVSSFSNVITLCKTTLFYGPKREVQRLP